MSKVKTVPPFMDLSPVAPLVETDTEIPKENLLKRCSGRVSRPFFRILYMLQFRYIGKNERGELYIC